MDTMSNKRKGIWLNEHWITPEYLKGSAEFMAWYMSLPRKNREGIIAVMKKSDRIVPYWTLHSKLKGFRTGKYYVYESVFDNTDEDSETDDEEKSDEETPPHPIE
jgi:hypothetical protein